MTPTPLFLAMQDGGVPLATIAALLILPIIATLIVMARQIIGLKGFTLFIPLLTAFVFHESGLTYGLTIFVVVVLAGTFTREILKRFRLQYLARMALVVTAAALAVLAVFFAAVFFNRLNFIQTSLLPLLVLIVLSEQFAGLQIEQGNKLAFAMIIETLLVAVGGYGLLSWPWLSAAVLHIPLLFIIGLVVVNVALGRWTGLRLLEYWRFRKIIKLKR